MNVDILGIRELKWTVMGEFNSDDIPWSLVFEPSSNISSLILELDLHASMMYCNISEIIPGPTFGQQKHKIIDPCKCHFNITFPVRSL